VVPHNLKMFSGVDAIGFGLLPAIFWQYVFFSL
jgi:hypothetical protein